MVTQQYSIPVLVVGAGPAGLIAALQLAKNGISCMLVERNLTTTKWPKMDITNCRSMELLKRLGIDSGLREVGVPSNFSFDVNISTGLSEKGQLIAKWVLPSPDAWRNRIQEQNDGSMPREPYQRCSQAIFEAWLKPKIQENPLIETHFGWKFESLVESAEGVESTVLDNKNQIQTIRSQYVIGCDGAGSKVRTAIGSKLEGGPVPAALHLIHFKSRELSKLQKQGQFWHIFFTSGSAIIAQDEIDTWTVHTPVPIDADLTSIDPKRAVYKALGGEHSPLEIEIDQILVTSAYRPNIYLADKYESAHGRVFISGDAAHQNIPTGGYGMNTAVGDSFDIGWKIAAVLAGHGGRELLRSYEIERRPVAGRNIERSGVHFSVHTLYWGWCKEFPGLVSVENEDGENLRRRIAEHITTHDGENKDHGIEFGYRYNGSPIIASENYEREPSWEFKKYVPSTWPGARAPHVFLADQETSVHDLFGSGNQYTLVDFTTDGAYVQAFKEAAKTSSVPLKYVHLPSEPHVRSIWERDAVLIRPDDHVAWRCPKGNNETSTSEAEAALSIATGHETKKDFHLASKESKRVSTYQTAAAPCDHKFTTIADIQDYEDVKGLGAFQ